MAGTIATLLIVGLLVLGTLAAYYTVPPDD